MNRDPDRAAKISIDNRLMLNDTGFDVVAGRSYHYEAIGEWNDGGIISDARGFTLWYLDLVGFLKRNRAARWGQLVAVVDKQPGQSVVLQTSGSFVAPATGRLWAYANDAPFAYGNNTGSISFTLNADQ